MKIVLITTTQPAANPRLVKEADTLAEEGHNVTVLYCYVADWAQKADETIFRSSKWKHIQVGGGGKKSGIYQKSRIWFALYRKLNKLSNGKLFAEQAHARCYTALLHAALKEKPNWYIGHNPGAMAITANAAKKNDALSGFDFEDYHRGEYAEENSISLKRQIYLEKKYINNYNYISAASLLIMAKIKSDFSALKVPVFTLLNAFPLKDQPVFRAPDENDEGLKLFWFSQHLGRDRGLEMIIQGLRELKNPSVSLTLAGNYSSDIKKYLINLAEEVSGQIHFAGVVPPYQLPQFASSFDVGLALELTFPLNRDICLTNKVFTYLLAGNAVIFSETSMQKNFNDEYRLGLCFPEGDKIALNECIKFYLDKKKLFSQRRHNYWLAKNRLNWDTESFKFKERIT